MTPYVRAVANALVASLSSAGPVPPPEVARMKKALVPELSYFTLFAPMVIMLALKPTGLYGRA